MGDSGRPPGEREAGHGVPLVSGRAQTAVHVAGPGPVAGHQSHQAHQSHQSHHGHQAGEGDPDEWRPLSLMENLRTYAADYTDLTHRLAKWLGVHTADAAAFAEILYAEDKGTPLSPARLSERIALSSGATTALLDRLERAGLLIRTREHADRRVVTLRSVPAISPVAREFFAPLGQRVGALMATYDQATLREFQRFLVDLHATMTDVSDNLDELVGERFDSHTREP